MEDVYPLSEWEEGLAAYYRKRKTVVRSEGAGELTPELLASMKKHFKRWKPDRWWQPEQHDQKEHTKGRKPPMLNNHDLVMLFDGLHYYDDSSGVPSFVDDILHGVARLDMGGNTRPMSKATIYALLSKLDKLSTNAIASALGLGARQSQRYMTMCGIAQDMIRREVVKRGMYNSELVEENDKSKILEIEEEKVNDEQHD